MKTTKQRERQRRIYPEELRKEAVQLPKSAFRRQDMACPNSARRWRCIMLQCAVLKSASTFCKASNSTGFVMW
jgi:hypothetical protein